MAAKILKRWPLLLAALLALACGFCLWRVHAVSHTLDSQRAAERWQGMSEQGFAQISCFMPREKRLTLEQLFTFRSDMYKKLKDASFDLEKDGSLYRDAWCSFGSAKVSAGRRSGTVETVAVGGSFFDFHPLRLMNGNYLRPDDLMHDRVLLDRETAWLLFGGADLAGMSFSLNGSPCVVAGVYQHEDDPFSRRASGETMRVYVSYAADAASMKDAAVDCYEFLMAEPVEGFVRTSAEEKFPIKEAEIITNSSRFAPAALWRLARSRAERSMHRGSAVYPYWENAARAAEDRAAAWLMAAVICGTFPLALLLYGTVRTLARGKKKLEKEIVPRAMEGAEEAIRARARKRWEKKHPGED